MWSRNHLDSKLVGVTQDHPLWWVSTTRNHQPGPIREGNRTQSPSYLFCSGTSPTVYDLLEGQATSDLQTTVAITPGCNGCYQGRTTPTLMNLMGRGFYHLWWPSSTTNPRSKACHTPSGIVEGPPGQDTTPKVCKQWPQRQDSEHANDLLGNVEGTSRLFVEICGLTVHTNTPGCNPIQLIPVPSRYWW
jgi:hypothetical protein